MTVANFARANPHLRDWYQMITTRAIPQSHAGEDSGHCQRRRRYTQRIRVNFFHYSDPKRCIATRVGLRVLPGISPIRLALLARGGTDELALDAQAPLFPFEGIVYDLPHQRRIVKIEQEVPVGLSRQLAQLPPIVRKNIDVSLCEDRIIATLAVTERHTLYVVFGREKPCPIGAVYMRDEKTGAAMDLRNWFPGKAPELGEVYAEITRRSRQALRSSTPEISDDEGWMPRGPCKSRRRPSDRLG